MRACCLILFAAAGAVCLGGGPSSTVEPTRLEPPGLPNVYRLNARLTSGGTPGGEAGFASLARLGIKTIISVDGARPDVEGARRHGLRYVHLPVGYDQVTQEQAWRIARAVRDLPGPVYLHCHHGKHRGPAAAVAALVCLEPDLSADAAQSVMRRLGTDPHYRGLYATPGNLRRPTGEELDRVPADFPEAARVPAFAQHMVELERRLDHLKLARRSAWKAPADHPDIDAPHEALQLREHYREAARLPEVRDRRPAEFVRWLADAEREAEELERALRATAGSEVEPLFQRVAASCTRCHAKYRDMPSR